MCLAPEDSLKAGAFGASIGDDGTDNRGARPIRILMSAICGNRGWAIWIFDRGAF